MPIPDFQSLMLPLLQFSSDGQDHSIRETVDHLADDFGLTPDERKKLLPSGRQAVFHNRVNWAKSYLDQSNLLEKRKRGVFRITDRGRHVLAKKPACIDMKFLEQFKEYREFRDRKGTRSEDTAAANPVLTEDPEERTPLEELEAAYAEIDERVVAELKACLANATPAFFERIVLDVITAMGYGGSRKEAAEVTQASADEGIDGIIKDDRLGLDTIYLQAKKWDGIVGRPEVQRFAGALQGQRARKGIFITTSTFSKLAEDFVKGIESKIILIDGQYLAQLMIEHNVGVSTRNVYTVKQLDSDYFEEG